MRCCFPDTSCRVPLPHPFLCTATVLLLSLGVLAATSVPSRVQGEKTPLLLEPGKTSEYDLGGSEIHTYRIDLTAGQFLQVTLEEIGSRVTVGVFAADGKLLVEFTGDNTRNGAPFYWIATETGSLRLQARSTSNESRGRYRIRVMPLRQATAEDNTRFAVQQAFFEGLRLRAVQRAESKREAIKKFESALQLSKDLGERRSEADALDHIGTSYLQLGEYRKALEFYSQSLPLWNSLGDQRAEAVTLNNIARAYSSLSDYKKALEHYDRSLSLSRAVGDRRTEGTTLNNIGAVYADLGDYRKALEFYGQALPISVALGDRGGQAVRLNNIGFAYKSLGQYQKAIEYYTQALGLRRAAGDRTGEAATISNIGVVYSNFGDYAKALDYNNQALTIRREVGDRRGEAITLNNIALDAKSLGQYRSALDNYSRALALQEQLGDRRGQAITTENIAQVYHVLGEYQKALEYSTRALLMKRDIGDRAGEATSLGNLGSRYEALGEYEDALDLYTRSLDIRREIGDRRGQSLVLNGMCHLYGRVGEYRKAFEYCNQSLQMRRELGDRAGQATVLANIALIYRSLGEHHKAIDSYNESLEISRALGTKQDEAVALNGVALTYHLLGQYRKALDTYRAALALFRSVGHKEYESIALLGIAVSERDLGNFESAKTHVDEALSIIESLRAKLAIPDFRSSYLGSRQNAYRLYVDVLMQLHKRAPAAGYDALAVQAAERGRARTLLETLNEERVAVRRGADTKLIERERDLQNRLNARAAYQLRLLSGEHTKEQADLVERDLHDLTAQYRQLQAEIRMTSPQYAALTQPRPIGIDEIRTQLLDRDTLLLEYALGNERSYVFCVAQDSIATVELPKGDAIEKAARRFYELLTARNQRIKFETPAERHRRVTETDTALAHSSTELSRMLLKPVADRLGKKRLLIVADGALQYIPFGALPSPSTDRERPSAGSASISRRPLILDHEVVCIPSASTLAVLRAEIAGRRPAEKTIAVIADPVFSADDLRLAQAKEKRGDSTVAAARFAARGETEAVTSELTRAVRDVAPEESFSLPRLPFTREEAKAIAALVPASQRIEAFDFRASRANATSSELGKYRIVHFATHGLLNSTRPELSGLVFSLVDENGQSQDGFLRAHEIYNLELPADLVVLSACRTGLGKDIRGEGIVGVTRAFMYAGAARVMVSLWDVNDQATANLMARFYQGMLGPKRLSPAAALRAAQMWMSKDKRWSAPYFWAGFILQGEPR